MIWLDIIKRLINPINWARFLKSLSQQTELWQNVKTTPWWIHLQTRWKYPKKLRHEHPIVHVQQLSNSTSQQRPIVRSTCIRTSTTGWRIRSLTAHRPRKHTNGKRSSSHGSNQTGSRFHKLPRRLILQPQHCSGAFRDRWTKPVQKSVPKHQNKIRVKLQHAQKRAPERSLIQLDKMLRLQINLSRPVSYHWVQAHRAPHSRNRKHNHR